MKLWNNKENAHTRIDAFTIGNDIEFDLLMAKFDIEGTLAHIKMLNKINLLSDSELEILTCSLHEMLALIEKGDFIIEQGVEDIHSQVEMMLTREHGDVGKKIHTGRSRNDQVLVDLRLFFRSEIKEIAFLIHEFFYILISQSKNYKNVLMPGYTHTQVAMVSSFGLWFSAYAEALIDDLKLLHTVYQINDQNPLGSAAGYGSSIPIDRKMTTRLLEFEDLAYNVVYAQMGRGKTEQLIAFMLSSIASTLGKMANDIVIFSNENFNFIQLPIEFTTGSSIMPHKKNPDVFELIRGHCNLLQSLPSQISMLNSNLLTGYHRDYQLLKEVIFPALNKLKDCLRLSIQCSSKININKDILKDEKYKYIYSVEKVNDQVQSGVPFREAYYAVSDSIKSGEFNYSNTINHTHEGSIGNLCLEEITLKFTKVTQSIKFFSTETNETSKV